GRDAQRDSGGLQLSPRQREEVNKIRALAWPSNSGCARATLRLALAPAAPISARVVIATTKPSNVYMRPRLLLKNPILFTRIYRYERPTHVFPFVFQRRGRTTRYCAAAI